MIVGIRIGLDRAAGQFTDPRIRLVPEPDPVDQTGGHRVITQHRRPVGQCVDGLRGQLPRFGDGLPRLCLQALDHPAVGLALRVGVAVFGENVCRRFVFTARDELGLDTHLVKRIAQERGVGGETDQSDRA